MKENNPKSFFLLNKILTIVLVSIYVFTMGVLSIYVYINRTIENTVITYPDCTLCKYEGKYIAPEINYKIPDILNSEENEFDGITYQPFYDYRYISTEYNYFLSFYLVSVTILLTLLTLTIYSYKKMRVKHKGNYYFRISTIFSGLVSVFIPFYTFFYLSEIIGNVTNLYLQGYFSHILIGIISMVLILLETILIIMVLRKEVRKYYFDSI